MNKVCLPANRQVVDGDLPKVLLVVNDEQASEWDAGLLVQHSVVASDAVRLVTDQGNVHGAETTCKQFHV